MRAPGQEAGSSSTRVQFLLYGAVFQIQEFFSIWISIQALLNRDPGLGLQAPNF